MKTCAKCGHENEKDANFCRECGSALTEVDNSKVTFVEGKKQIEEDFLCFGDTSRSNSGFLIIGVVFIIISLIAAIAMFTNFFSDFGNTMGSMAGGFGETMGQIGADIGEFFGNWGTNFGNAVSTFFGGISWWDFIKPLIVLFFLVVGIILIVINRSKR